ncbi:MAG: DUF4124 domain-containing protein [Myxococcales bacterium]|nr:DUF4124 domain-containing protein [Myxococcales bacterium]
MARVIVLFFSALSTVAVAGAAAAEIYRCVGRDGKVTFTTSQAACPGAKPHELKGRVEHMKNTPPPARRTRGAGRLSAELEEAQAAQWRAKKVRAQQDLESAKQRSEQWRQFVAWCNRGGELYETDRSGLRKDYSCGQADREWEAAEAQRKALAHYLAEGLEEECRRSECLPGWIR